MVSREMGKAVLGGHGATGVCVRRLVRDHLDSFLSDLQKRDREAHGLHGVLLRGVVNHVHLYRRPWRVRRGRRRLYQRR